MSNFFYFCQKKKNNEFAYLSISSRDVGAGADLEQTKFPVLGEYTGSLWTQNHHATSRLGGVSFFCNNLWTIFCFCRNTLIIILFKQEQELYDKEGLGVKTVTYIDNQDCIGEH